MSASSRRRCWSAPPARGSLIQDDPGGLARALESADPGGRARTAGLSAKENWGAAETFYQLVRALAGPSAPPPGTKRPARDAGQRPRCNLLGPTALGFRHRDDVAEIIGAAGAARRRRQRRGAAGRDARRSRAAGRGRFQRRAVSGDRRTGGVLAAADVRPAVDQDRADRRRRPRANSSPKWPASRASMPRPCSRPARRGCPGIRARSTRPISPASASSSSATRRTPSPPRASRPRNSASRSSASAPTAANSPARCAKRRSATASRR